MITDVNNIRKSGFNNSETNKVRGFSKFGKIELKQQNSKDENKYQFESHLLKYYDEFLHLKI